MEDKNTKLANKFTIEELEAAHYLAMGLQGKQVKDITGVPTERIKELQKDTAFMSIVAEQRINIATGLSAARSALIGLGTEKLIEILSQDYKSAPEGEKREIARTARFAIEIASGVTQQSPVTNNLVVGEDGVKVLARHIAMLQDGSYGSTEDIEREIRLSDMAEAYVCAPGTIKGIINYDPDTEEFQCHICGKWFPDIEEHCHTHGLSFDEYKAIFEINYG